MRIIRHDEAGTLDVMGVPTQPPTMSKSRKQVTVATCGFGVGVDGEGDEYGINCTVTRPSSAFDAADLKAAEKRRAEKDEKQEK